MKLRLEFNAESSKKFWEPRIKGQTLKVQFGKIGTTGQSHTKSFPSPDKALAEYRKAICEKLAKGYKPTKESVVELLRNASSVETPAAIASLYIGEHVPDEVTQDVCGWATTCLQQGMTPKQFKSVWSKFLDGGDEEIEEALGQTGDEPWLDVTEWGEGDLHDLYAKAVENGGDRFIWFNNNAYIDIVALRGDPGARAIQVCVLTEKNCKDAETGKWLDEWPVEAGPGAPIASVHDCSADYAVLRDSTEVKAKMEE